jgi:hypothetical protein
MKVEPGVGLWVGENLVIWGMSLVVWVVRSQAWIDLGVQSHIQMPTRKPQFHPLPVLPSLIHLPSRLGSTCSTGGSGCRSG